MTNLLKFTVLLLLPLVVIYPVFGFILWNWDVRSWNEATRVAYVWLSLSAGIVTAAVWDCV